ncbi:hypothetical protein SDC9_143427 [bioreactor metagenome]|uniref:Uncharacterized protein n=1 Tax=bioreactor metagenome TaxID=1076179 RepID=A0A645E405_9ZZZZ
MCPEQGGFTCNSYNQFIFLVHRFGGSQYFITFSDDQVLMHPKFLYITISRVDVVVSGESRTSASPEPVDIGADIQHISINTNLFVLFKVRSID